MIRRVASLAILSAGLAGVAACGSTSATPTSSPSPSGGRGNRGGAGGEVAQINGSTIIVNSQSGDITVLTSADTTVTRTSTGTVADLVAGSCLTARGSKDSAGIITVTQATVSPRTGTSCQRRPGPSGSPRPSPSGTPRPSRSGQPQGPAVAGQISSVTGTTVTLMQDDGTTLAVNVPTTVRINKVADAALTDIKVGNCIVAVGPRDSQQAVQARAISIVPPGPSGCLSGGRGFAGAGGPGGAGGAGFGGGFGGGPPGGGGPPPD
jgi:hypothetical protein